MKLLIIADDLTGALDTAAQFARKGAKTLAAVEPTAAPAGCSVLSVNLNMRHDNADVVYDKVSALLRQFPDVPYIYIKTDSALRGNLSAAFAAVLSERGGPVYFIPAYPKAGRTTVGGWQFIGGVPLEKSVFADDPLNPMKTGSVNEILNKSHTVGDVEIFDCETQERLSEIADGLFKRNNLRITAGCAGFAEILAEYIDFECEPIKYTPADSPVLFLNGSANRVTADQIAYGAERGVDVFYSKNLSILARKADEFVKNGNTNLAIFGGDTAFAVLRALGCGFLRVITEIKTGIPLCTDGRLMIATKSGGLGEIDAVTVIDRFLRYGRQI